MPVTSDDKSQLYLNYEKLTLFKTILKYHKLEQSKFVLMLYAYNIQYVQA